MRRRSLKFVLSASWGLFLLSSSIALAASGTRNEPFPTARANGPAGQLLDKPMRLFASPYRPKSNRDTILPVALKGFSVVTLRNSQQWLSGQKNFQLVFDGQIYWFTSAGQRAIFAAAPSRYVPALGGDCVVTYQETGQRKPGSIEYGLVHDQRLFFFASLEMRELFRSAPARFAQADLATEGRCLVSETDAGLDLPGMPETLVIVDGIRYVFYGTQQRSQFLANRAHYGVQPPATVEPPQGPRSSQAAGSAARDEGSAKPLPTEDESATVPLAMQGFCPVTIRSNGLWKSGNPASQTVFDGKQYLFVGPKERALFLKKPGFYLPAFAGDCPVTWIDFQQRVPGSVYDPVMYQGRLYLLAGASEKSVFKADPTRFANADIAADGKCVVTLVEEEQSAPGRPEFETWHRGTRYRFASADRQAKFETDRRRYLQDLASRNNSLDSAEQSNHD